ncbi:hypothetical protein CU254_40290 [Amycolatopsis sp. AA4]|uniref:hypothetical protein n=1 Tax=Actinomycetes TaxID=1760 RepID=UPI0001B53B8D|nr:MULTISPECIES: hypothetical protein [Actinomycetes]ATY15934.1 hypothetical protein CU254_40290 [Amycolatopsis sp. AA4]EFL12267.1 hypothetical protein SSMG_07938 [Streptomyces sp. AA4]
MTDELERLRAALQEAPAEPFKEPDLDRIFQEGGRIRRRRRFLTSSGAAVAVVAVVFGAVWLRSPGGAPEQVHAAAAPPPSSITKTTSTTPIPAPTTAESRPLGEVISTGTYADGAELVFYATQIEDPDNLPTVQFGVMASLSEPDGNLRPLYLANESEGQDRSFGFHATSGGTTISDIWVPVYGYFSGPAARIETTVDGRTIQAHTARWSEDPDVVVFWFDQDEVPSAERASPLVAYSADGKRLTK